MPQWLGPAGRCKAAAGDHCCLACFLVLAGQSQTSESHDAFLCTTTTTFITFTMMTLQRREENSFAVVQAVNFLVCSECADINEPAGYAVPCCCLHDSGALPAAGQQCSRPPLQDAIALTPCMICIPLPSLHHLSEWAQTASWRTVLCNGAQMLSEAGASWRWLQRLPSAGLIAEAVAAWGTPTSEEASKGLPGLRRAKQAQ